MSARLLLPLFFLALPLSVFAQTPDVSKIKVNGYDVFLINMHKGNAVAFTANVQTGSWHDDPIVHAGRAHLWEHVIHGGTTKYPGHSRIWAENSALGATYNAYTSNDRTFYHYVVHPESLPKAASILGAMVSTPEWNPETFVKEKSTVKNEAKEYQMQDAQAFESGTYLYLTPPNHPLAMYNVGTQEQLDHMSLLDLKELFYSNYVPGRLQVVVAGNFDALPDGTTPVTVEQIRGLVKENFIPPNASLDPQMKGVTLPTANREKVFPSIVDAKNPTQPRSLEMGTQTNNRTLKLLFEADAGMNRYAFETLSDYLNLRMDGTLSEYLKNKNLVTSVSTGAETTNNLNVVEVYFRLTEKGAAHRKEITEQFFALLQDIRQNGIAPEILEYLKTRNIESYSKTFESTKGSAEFFAKSLDENLSGKDAFNFKKKYGSITQADLARVIDQGFPIDRMLTAYMGPDVVSPATDGVFGRPYRVTDNSADRAALKEVLAHGSPKISNHIRPILDPVKLDFTAAPRGTGKVAPQKLKRKILGQNLIIEQNHVSTQGALSINIQAPSLTIEQRVALNFFVGGFTQRNAGRIDFIQSYGIDLSVDAGSGLNIAAEGNSGAAKSALKWAFDGLKQYQASADEIQRVMNSLAQAHAGAQATFTANVATAAATVLLKKTAYDSEALFQTAVELSKDPARINALVKEALTQADLSLVAYGDFLPKEMNDLLDEARLSYPQSLSIEQRRAERFSNTKIDRTTHFWKGLDASKDENAFGRAKIFKGPRLGTDDAAALSILNGLLYAKTFSINRIRNELGYVHGASVMNYGSNQRIMFYGQYEGAERAEVLEAGWQEVIDMVRDQTITSDGFESEKTGLLRKLTILPTSSGALLSNLAQSYSKSSKDFSAKAKFIERIKALTPEQIYASGQKYLIDQPSMNVYVSKNIADIDCNGVMHTRVSDIR